MTTPASTGAWNVGARLRGTGAAGLYEARDGAGAPALVVVVQGVDEDAHDRCVLQAIGRGAVVLPDGDRWAVTAALGRNAQLQAEALFAEFASAVGLDATVTEPDPSDWRPPAPLDPSRRPRFLPPSEPAAEAPAGDAPASAARAAVVAAGGYHRHWRTVVPALLVFLVMVFALSIAVRPMLVERDQLHQLRVHDQR